MTRKTLKVEEVQRVCRNATLLAGQIKKCYETKGEGIPFRLAQTRRILLADLQVLRDKGIIE